MTAAQGFVDLLDATPNLTVHFDRPVPDRPSYPYCVVYESDAVESSSLTSGAGWETTSVQTTCVGVSPEQVRELRARARVAVLDQRPTVAGRSCGLVELVSSQKIRRDPDLPTAVFYAVDVWQFFHVSA